MRVLIIEDEIPAAEKLERYLNKYDPFLEILATLGSVEKSVNWFTTSDIFPDLIFMDIQLTDGLSFEIFKKVKITQPIIFTTAFNQYAIDAFKANGIDYLLKPITFQALSNSLKKFDQLKQNFTRLQPDETMEILKNALSKVRKSYKDRFMVKSGEHIRSVPTDQISIFFAEGKNVFIVTNYKMRYLVDYKMEELDDILDPHSFYRVNRSFMVNIAAVEDVLVYSKSRLKVIPTQDFEREIIVSREKVAAFKDWFNGFNG